MVDPLPDDPSSAFFSEKDLPGLSGLTARTARSGSLFEFVQTPTRLDASTAAARGSMKECPSSGPIRRDRWRQSVHAATSLLDYVRQVGSLTARGGRATAARARTAAARAVAIGVRAREGAKTAGRASAASLRLSAGLSTRHTATAVTFMAGLVTGATAFSGLLWRDVAVAVPGVAAAVPAVEPARLTDHALPTTGTAPSADPTVDARPAFAEPERQRDHSAVLPASSPTLAPLARVKGRDAPSSTSNATGASASTGAGQRLRAVSRRPAAQASGFRGSLTIQSRPSGATVFVNGRAVGTTPILLDNQAAGSRAVRVSLDGYDTWSGGVRVVANQRSVVTASLRRSAHPVATAGVEP